MKGLRKIVKHLSCMGSGLRLEYGTSRIRSEKSNRPNVRCCVALTHMTRIAVLHSMQGKQTNRFCMWQSKTGLQQIVLILGEEGRDKSQQRDFIM